jgi:hypothetical protein
MYSSKTNKMQIYAMAFIAINVLPVSGGFSAHHQKLKTVYTASGICRGFSASYRYREWVGTNLLVLLECKVLQLQHFSTFLGSS